MKILNLDINSKNKNIGQVEKCDSTKLICTLEENDYSNSTIRILGKKADKTLVEQIVEITGNKIEVTLNKQFTSCEGITRIEINIVTDEEEWTSNENYFYVSDTINSNIIKSINDVKTLDDLDQYLIYAKEEILNIKAELETVSLDKLLEVKNILEIENNKANTSITTLKALIDNSIQAKKNLDGSIGTATTINSELTTTTTQANTSKDLLVSIINTANTSKSALDGSIGSATSIDTTLKATTTSANTSKSNLEKATTTANTSKSNLESVTVAANNKKKELDTSITGATNKIVEITNKNTEATSKITTLTNKITEATTCKSNLDISIVEGEATKNAIDEAIVNGDLEKVTTQLFDITQEVTDARVGYFGKEHATLQDRLNDEFQFVTVDNSRGMYVEQSTDTSSMKIENSIEGRARDTVIKGRTLQNLCPFDFPIDRWSGGTSTWMHTSYKKFDMLQPEKTYSILVYGNISNFSNYRLGHANDASQNIMTGNKIGIFVSFKFKEVSGIGLILNKTVSEGYTQAEKDSIKCIILEGDHTANPPTNYFEGIKSLGEEDNNRISILSTNNLIDYKDKKVTTGMTNFLELDGGYSWDTTSYGVGVIVKVTGLVAGNKYTLSVGESVAITTRSNIIDPKNDIPLSSKKLTFTALEASGEITFKNTSPTTSCKFTKLTLTSGENIGVYQPYQSDKKDILLPVSNGAKGLFKGVSDEILANGDYLQRIGNVRIKDLSWTIAIKGDDYHYSSRIVSCIPRSGQEAICSNLKYVDGLWNHNLETSKNAEGFDLSGVDVVSIQTQKAKNLNEFINLFGEFTIYYELKEPILHKAESTTNNNLATFKDITHVSCLNKIAPSSISAKFPINLANFISRLNTENKKLEYKNIELENNLIKQAIHFKNEDLDLMASNLELDFRIMDIEFVIESSIVNTKKHKKGNDIMSPYTMMKKLILGGRYEKEDMEYKISVYLQRGKITEVEAQELRDLILANEIIS